MVILVKFLFVLNLISASFAFLGKISDGVGEVTAKSGSAVQDNPVGDMATSATASVTDLASEVGTLGRAKQAHDYTRFFFFTRFCRDCFTEIKAGEKEKLLKARFCPCKKIKICFPGWLTDGTDNFPIAMKDAYLDCEDMNVFTVDWEEFSKCPVYTIAVTASEHVGKYAANFVNFLVKEMGARIEDIHLLGFSLGAHTAGTTGEFVQCGKLLRITGFDPAGPLFASDPSFRLDPTDAKFVDVIHTSIGTLGYTDPCGHADFYPNGGYHPQPGKSLLSPQESHSRSWQYFAESICNNYFVAKECCSHNEYEDGKCDDNLTAYMGDHVDKSISGVFYLNTNPCSPWALGERHCGCHS